MRKVVGQDTSWRPVKFLISTILLFCLVFVLYIWRLGTLISGFSAHEVVATSKTGGSGNLSAIKNNPLDAPHKILQFVFQHFGHHGAFWMRSVSVFFALLFLLVLFLQLRKWFGKYIAAIGTLFLATTPWVVLAARNASADIMLLAPVLIVYAYLGLTSAQKRITLSWFLLVLCLAVALYVPGMVWFILLGIIFSYQKLLQTIAKVNPAATAAGILLLIVLLIPLGYGIYQHHSLIKDWLLIPHSFSDKLLNNLGAVIATLVFKAKRHSDYMLGGLPVLSILQSILALIGLGAMAKSARREMMMMVGLIVISVVLAALNNNPYLLIISSPAVIVLDSAALRYLLRRWQKIFPLNPVPRTFATILICMLVLAQVTYGIRYSLIAWPHNLETRNTYVLK